MPYNGAGHWCKYADLRRAAAKHVDDADAALRAVLERFDLWDFYDQVGRQRAHVEAAPRPDGRPLTDRRLGRERRAAVVCTYRCA